jgi:hypothetical protein
VSASFLLQLLAVCFLALFAAVWCWIAWQLRGFHATDMQKFVSLPNDIIDVAGFLGTAVATGTAAVLGIHIQEVKTAKAAGDGGDAKGNVGSLKLRWLLVLGVVVYAAVGAFVVAIWLSKSEVAPDVIRAYGLGVVGWLAGAFAAYFHTSTT